MTDVTGRSTPSVALRKFPYPFQAMLAISTDIDRTSMTTFRNIHRFVNTLEDTPMGHGVGLDIADSLWVFKAWNNTGDIALFKGYGSSEPESYAEELAYYANVGWIDTLHTYGNYSVGAGESAFERRHGEVAIRELRAREIFFTTWVNHGSKTNNQNFGYSAQQAGDDPGSRAYHTDLLLEYGVRFGWNQRRGHEPGVDSPITPMMLRDGHRLWGFPRYNAAVGSQALEVFERHGDFYARNPALRRERPDGMPVTMLWWPALLDCQLSRAVLDDLVDRGQCCVAAQHLGRLGGQQEFSVAAVEAFRLMRRYQDDGLILITRTSRLLEYSRVAENLEYQIRTGGRLEIEITAVRDPVIGTFVPTLGQLRGVTFYVPDPAATYLYLNGRPIPRREIRVWPTDGNGSSIGIKWFEDDTTDYVASFVDAGNASAARVGTPV